MKKILLLPLLFFTIHLSAQNPSDEQQLKDLIQNSFDDIFSEMNIDKLDTYFTSDFLLLEVGEVWDMERIKSELSSYDLQGRKRKNEFEFIEVKIKDNTAWIAYHNTATFIKDGEVVGERQWLESAIAVRTKNGWKLDMLHSTRKSSEE
ncbi:uncharacterized protein DUF4440 [Christiangramia gaetbulicola]|uniref:Uncharacterized protein DUF4440 n=1 Tax=Christiangramia gaetbulicola TaxID=703340 RepID=A0A2T6ADR5_9FLAO|nr:DUF4440 domain-containing protein [Christiangramia gaetbulicola]PTX41926.1 uncharacterized protein DUF4440 [Christiangramia gaetbulicola]